MANQGSTFSSTRVSKIKPNNTLNDARNNHQRSEPPKVNTLSQFGPGGNKTLHVGHILEAHNDNSKKASSVSKISLLANKLDKIKMYNQEARVVQK